MSVIATCPQCSARYGGRREHCNLVGCHQTFNSTAAGDMHRVGPYMPRGLRRCLSPDEMLAKGMTQANGVWYGPRKSGGSHPRGATQGGEQDPAHGAVTPWQVTP